MSRPIQNQGDAEKTEFFSRYLAESPEASFARDCRGLLYLKQGNAEEALADFDAAVRIRQNIRETWTLAHYHRALALEKLGRQEEAASDYAKVAADMLFERYRLQAQSAWEEKVDQEIAATVSRYLPTREQQIREFAASGFSVGFWLLALAAWLVFKIREFRERSAAERWGEPLDPSRFALVVRLQVKHGKFPQILSLAAKMREKGLELPCVASFLNARHLQRFRISFARQIRKDIRARNYSDVARTLDAMLAMDERSAWQEIGDSLVAQGAEVAAKGWSEDLLPWIEISRHFSDLSHEIQKQILDLAVKSEKNHPAWLGLAMLELELEHGLDSGKTPKTNKSLLVDCRSFRKGKTETLPSIVRKLGRFPADPLREKILGKLRQSLPTPAAEFGQADPEERPQMFESIEAPLTWLKGARIGCWRFEDAGQAKLATTGRGAGVRERMRAVLAQFSQERGCGGDLLTAECSLFDLAAQSPERAGERGKAASHARKFLDSLGIAESVAKRLEKPGADLASLLASGGESIVQILEECECNTGLVKNVRIEGRYEAACEAVRQGREPERGVSFPVFAPHRQGESALRVSLPKLCLGGAEYGEISRLHRDAVFEEMHRENRRRLGRCERKARELAELYAQLESAAKGGEEGKAELLWSVDPETGDLIALESAERIEIHLGELAGAIVREAARSGWIRCGLEALPERKDFAPLWHHGYLADAFLYGRDLGVEPERIPEELLEKWNSQRPLALACLKAALDEQGVPLSRLSGANSVFRLVEVTDEDFVFEPVCVFDAGSDLPSGQGSFSPAFGARERIRMDADDAREKALEAMDRFLESHSWEDLRASLCLDGGEALDRCMEVLVRPFLKEDLPDQVRRVTIAASTGLDPVTALHIHEKARKDPSPAGLFSLGYECKEEGDRLESVPDFYAWHLFLVGRSLQEALRDIECDPQRYAEKFGEAEIREAKELASRGVWEIVGDWLDKKECAPLVEKVLLDVMGISSFSSVGESREKLQKWPAYAERCGHAEEEPPRSEEIESQYVPGCLLGWDRISYEVIQGDIALWFAWSLREGFLCGDAASLENAIRQWKNLPIPSAFRELAEFRARLSEQVDSELDPDVARAIMRDAEGVAMGIAENSYLYAVEHDSEFGSGRLRLVRAKWLAGDYLEALRLLVGPAGADVFLPLGLVVSENGGEMDVEMAEDASWSGPEGLSVVSSLDEEDWILEFGKEEAEFARVSVSGLGQEVREALHGFFGQQAPEGFSPSCRSGAEAQRGKAEWFASPGRETFELWLASIRVPNMGARGKIARALEGERLFVLLLACVELGIPQFVGRPPRFRGVDRPEEWRNQDVIAGWK